MSFIASVVTGTEVRNRFNLFRVLIKMFEFHSELEKELEFSEKYQVRVLIPALVVGDRVIKMATISCNLIKCHSVMEILFELVTK